MGACVLFSPYRNPAAGISQLAGTELIMCHIAITSLGKRRIATSAVAGTFI